MAATLQLKIIKDWVQDAPADPAAAPGPPAPPRLRLLRTAFLPFHLYVRLDIPLPPASDPALSNERLSLRLVASAGASADGLATAVALQPPAPATTPRPRARRVLALLSCPEAPPGRYLLRLVRDGAVLAEAGVARRADQLRVLGRAWPPAGPRPLPVLISGTPKSGTTWVEKVVNAHPDILVLHEANTLRMIETKAIAQDLDRRAEFFATRHIPWLPAGFDTRDFAPFLQISLARALMTRLGEAWGARCVADRTPGYADLYAHLPGFWEEARVVHVVRHPLDVVTSWLFHEARASRDPERRVQTPRPVLEALNAKLDRRRAIAPGGYVSDAAIADGALHYFARRWRREQAQARRARDDAKDQFHLLTYEALSQDFAATAAALFAFLGFAPTQAELARIERDASFRALSGGREKGRADARSFFRKGVVGDWAQVFSPGQAAVLWAEVADVATAFGYALEPAKEAEAA